MRRWSGPVELEFWHTVEREDGDVDVLVTYTATPDKPARIWDMPEENRPAESGDCEIISIDPEVSREEERQILAVCCERSEQDLADWQFDNL